MMKYCVALLLVLGYTFAQEAAQQDPAAAAADAPAEKDGEPRPRIYRRIIPADVLRDFPNHCFASTLCKLFEPDQDWSLEPFCGQSHCYLDEKVGRLFEVVLDCGPKPTNPDACKILTPANETAVFPKCCDVYDTETCKFPEFNAPEGAGNKQAPPEGALQGRPKPTA
ncbi:unnamed protein product [Notodromas monacha]|uniref:Single domain-containing protein n=1 Tax=Notodromas monacha TaxID=399045 RepID=A0A7R9BLZ2_9CRUS|nr:unnamed protein product [Notodromas monacha]CAG0917952.1 unnamed protein product [Notodromas monacha]